jgi:hypothetical protein
VVLLALLALLARGVPLEQALGIISAGVLLARDLGAGLKARQ